MNKSLLLRQLLNKKGMITVPGVYDCLSAKIAEKTGFEILFTSGFGIAATSYGLPDYGLVTGNEMIQSIIRIVRSVNIPVVADIDTGYGNALNVIRTVNEVVQGGVAGIIIEDQKWPKRCGHLEGKEIIEAEEHIQRIKAARYSGGKDLIIIARTDARAVMGLDEAIRRGHLYIEAGADILFIEAPESTKELETITSEFKGIPLFVNMVEGGKTPYLKPSELEHMGFKIAVYPLCGLFAVTQALMKTYSELKEGTFSKDISKGINFDTFKSIIDIEIYKKLEKKFKITD